MAIRFAVANGNWSSTSTWNGGTLPTSADDVYSNNFTVTIDQNITALSLNNIAATGVTAGGGFVLDAGITVALNGPNAMQAGSVNLLTFSASGTSTINCGTNLIRKPTSGTNTATILISGTGTLNVTGNLSNTNDVTTVFAIYITASGTLNLVGNVGYQSDSVRQGSYIRNTVNCTITVVGNVFGSWAVGSTGGIYFTGGTLNVVGNARGGGNANDSAGIYATGGVINITGDLLGGANTNNRCSGLYAASASVVSYVTGNMYSGSALPSNGGYASLFAAYLYHVGAIYAGPFEGLYNVVATAINILSGPFVSSTNGMMPFIAQRVFLINSGNTYFEFRDSSTNGAAVPPNATAPAYRLASPDIAGTPAASDVRNGVVYSGSFVGTLKVPSPDQVSKGIPTDNTVGTAVLKPEDVWNHLVANISTPNSIGERLKNAATVETTGAQVAAFNG